MSGVAFNKSWSFTRPLNWADRLAKQLEFAGESEAEMLEFLENANAADLVKAEELILSDKEKYGMHIAFPFGPVVEPYESQNCFIPKDPVLLAREAWSKNMDCIIGYTSFEGLIMSFIEKLPVFEKFIDAVKKNVAFFAPLNELGLDENSDLAKSLGKKIKEIYFGLLQPTKSNMEPYYYVSPCELLFLYNC